ncbi:GNAT family N-acetyltransferase [Streptomyces thermolineatus]|uniref:bifunctional acetate--CoA ligase family protein/GNAT family N-acetyltransferase n=1 Tax=Streptomyces thermolineatus TaxID=44033 RepID=UPI003850F132
MQTSQERAYPVHWEADVVLRDGGTAHVRPITPDDAERLVHFYSEVSDESKYYRFFAPYPRLSDRDVHRFTHHDYVDRVGLAALVNGEFIATVRYDRTDGAGRSASDGAQAEVAFLVQDAHQGRGVASALLEHIAAVARERGIRRFVAEVLPANRKMIKVFTDAGYTQRRSFADGVVHLEFDLEPTEASVEVMRAREQRAEARSVQRLLTPRSVAVIGAGRSPGSVGRSVVGHLLEAGFTGRVHAVNRSYPADQHVLEPEGIPAHRSVSEIEQPVDLAVVAVPADQVVPVIDDCGAHGVQGLVVLTSGHPHPPALPGAGAPGAPAPAHAPAAAVDSREWQRSLVRRARSYGMRIIGPNALGVINLAEEVRLNASLVPHAPAAGRIGLFTQSGAIGLALLDEVHHRGGGLSSFVSAGDRADVSGNDLIQYWHDDPATDVVLMYLESFGNPRKFTRLARRTAAAKPLVVVKSGRHPGAVPAGHSVPHTRIPDSTVDALFRQAGVIRAQTVTDMLDTGLLLAFQPLPAGPRVAVLGNSESLGLLTYDACLTAGLSPRHPLDLTTEAVPEDFRRALAAAVADPGCDAVVVTAIPRVDTAQDPDGRGDRELADALREAALGSDKPVLVVHFAFDQLPGRLAGPATRIPAYPSAERAVRALTEAVHYADWRRRAATPGRVPQFEDIRPAEAARDVAAWLDAADAERPGAAAPDGPGVPLAEDTAARLLAHYGITVHPALPAPGAEAALAAAERLGYPVALKATAPHLRHRADLGGVHLDLAGPAELRRAYGELTSRLGKPDEICPVVQRLAPRGVDTVVRATVDPRLGAVLGFGLAGAPSELLGDLAHRLLPATDRDVAELVRSIRAAPMLFGYRGAQPVDTAALEELLLRVAVLLDDIPEVVGVGLEPVVVAPQGLSVLGASVRIARPPARTDLGPRALAPWSTAE